MGVVSWPNMVQAEGVWEEGQRGLLDIRLPEDRHMTGTGQEGIVGSQQTSHHFQDQLSFWGGLNPYNTGDLRETLTW